MFDRLVNPLKTKSFFLFGARGVGKSTFIQGFTKNQRTLVFDLLDPEVEDRLLLAPESLRSEVLAALPQLDWVVIDEVQKCPKLLNVVHKLIVEQGVKFALTGSSARRLKQKGVNLLAGRALTESLHPLTSLELKTAFSLSEVLEGGTLPEAVLANSEEERRAYLRSYALNYIKHEIQAEQWVRNLEPFRRFLGIAAQMNGKVLNYSAIARDVGVESNTVQSYFENLEDTLVAFRLPGYNRSIRKQQRQSPKFYFFDLGVKRALDRTLEIPLKPGTAAYGEAFEHFIVLEIYRLSSYQKKDYELSYLLTKDGAEIDLILERPGKSVALIEIKSKNRVDEHDARHLEHFRKDFTTPELFLLSNDPNNKRLGAVSALYWRDGLREIMT
ncbi:MAG: ATP-binding protein [Oligoflexales bacterium]|nr:ATP-binding protein [Oligoflexales bacterium]